MKKNQWMKLLMLFSLFVLIGLPSCKDPNDDLDPGLSDEFKNAGIVDNSLTSGIYLGVIGFNQTVNVCKIQQLNNTTVDNFFTFVNKLTMQNGTLLYYSVEQALNSLEATPLPKDVSTVAMVTFTDGLDQGSMMKNDKYGTDERYLDALNHRILYTKILNNPITAYSIGVKGNDVSNIALFRDNLDKLASSSENSTEVTSMQAVNAKFQQIAQELSQSNFIQTITLKMPGLANGTSVRFTFDNASNADNSKKYIEGVFNLNERSLEQVEYFGLKSKSGSTVKGKVEGIFVTFTFEGVRSDDGVLIESKNTDEWTYVASNHSWQINSEFDKNENSDIENTRSSAVIMLVLDCSSSLGSEFETAKGNAKNFIKTLYRAINSSETETPNPSAHAYVDLGLPSGLKWATCNVGALFPEDYGNYYAWGEIKPKETYYQSNSLTYGKSLGDISGNPQYDAARANWGGNWRMPTYEEGVELLNKCTWTWTSLENVKGYKVTGPNGNYIFLPATGYCNGSSLTNAGSGYYWTSTPCTPYEYYGETALCASSITFNTEKHYDGWVRRDMGVCVRPVTK